MQRILEPEEVMDKKENIIAYASADFSSVNQKFVDDLIKKYSKYLNNILDLGCGPADIPIRLASILPKVNITAVDASKEMLEMARVAISKANFENKISLIQGYVPGLPLKPHTFDAIISNSLLHHLPTPDTFWEEIKRLGKNGTAIFVMDLLRPPSEKKAREIVENYSKDEPEVLKEDFYNSLLAAFTLDEMKEQLKKANLTQLNPEIISDRHWLVTGIL